MSVVMGMLCVGYHLSFYKFEFAVLYGELALTCVEPALTLRTHPRCAPRTPDRIQDRAEGTGRMLTGKPSRSTQPSKGHAAHPFKLAVQMLYNYGPSERDFNKR